MTSRADELLEMFNDYDKRAVTSTETVTKTIPKLWKPEKYEWPPLPAMATGVKLVSDLLECKPEQLPGPDFEMPMFEVTAWPEEVRPHVPSPDESDIEHYVMPREAGYWTCYGLRMNKPVYAAGVKGCGKSTLFKRICALLNWPFIRKQMAKDLDSSEFFGQWTAKDGSTEFIPGDLPQAAAMGAVLLVDEIAAAPPELHPSLHWVLEKGGKVYLNSKDGSVEDKIITPAETFRIVAADNTRGQGDPSGRYAGTDALNSATMDRFRVMIVMDYMDERLERKVIKNTVPMCTDLLAKNMLQVAKRVRAGYASGELSETLSMRPLIEWAEKAVLTHDVMNSLRMTMLNKIESESERQEIESYVQSVFGSLLNEK